MVDERDCLRHFLASIAYHATKAIKDPPENYPELDVGNGARTPRRILHHITGVLTYAHSFYTHYETTWFKEEPWEQEIENFYSILERLDASITETDPREVSHLQLLQGPFSDSMAHVGQLLMLRRIAGSPVPSENFIYADIRCGAVGRSQPPPVAPDK